jgi:hypothetical protein
LSRQQSKNEHIRGVLGVLLILASVKFLLDLVIPPTEYYVLGGGLW